MDLIRPRVPPVHGLLIGALAGAAATVVMSIVMLAAGRLGLMRKQPPERIVERGASAAGVRTSEQQQNALASGLHVAFGAAIGAAFGLMARLGRPAMPELLAIPWALVVWAVSYFGWVPALRILPPPTEDAPGRAWTMLIAHLVFGVALGALWRTARRRVGIAS